MNLLKETESNGKPSKCLRSNVHIFDSARGVAGSSSYLFKYTQPYINPVFFRVQDITIFDFPDYNNNNIFFIATDLTGASNSTYNSGIASSVIASCARVGSSGPAYKSEIRSTHIKLSGAPLHQVVFTLLDENYMPIKNARFVVSLVVYIS